MRCTRKREYFRKNITKEVLDPPWLLKIKKQKISIHVFSSIHEVVNKYNKDALLLDHYQQSESQKHNVTLKIQASVGENRRTVAQFSTQMMLLAHLLAKKIRLIISFKSGARTHLAWNQKLPILIVLHFSLFWAFFVVFSYSKKLSCIFCSDFLTQT